MLQFVSSLYLYALSLWFCGIMVCDFCVHVWGFSLNNGKTETISVRLCSHSIQHCAWHMVNTP